MSRSSSTRTINCNVFLSFMSQDTRGSRSFVSHLRGSLNRKGYTITELENDPSRSESGPHVVDRAITDAKVAVVVISENFVSSAWCLESLVGILDFQQSGSLALLIPVFYEIDPLDVKNQSGKLREQFSSHEIENAAKVQTWRLALSQLVDLPGGQHSDFWKGDAELIGRIADDIWDFFIGAKSTDFSGLVGMDRHMKALYGLLDLVSMDEVREIIICGEHKIGKTELAKYLYQEISHHFDTRIWLDRGTRFDYDNEDIGYIIHSKVQRNRPRARRPRVLLVLDNLYMDEINDLEKEIRSFGPGSRVIITTQKHQRLFDSLAHHWYEVVGLETSEALQLFCLHAFGQTHVALGFEGLSSRAVKLTGGCPTTIKNMGSGLSGRDRNEWEAILSDYENSSVKGIIDPYKINLYEQSSVKDRVSSQSRTISNFDGLVGMDARMQAVSQLLELGSNNEVRVVGIWGTEGIGKTTLAKYAYDGISQNFHTTVFIESSEDHHSSCLEERFLSKAIEREAFAIRNAKDGLDVVKSGIRHHKVLLIVDGVEKSKALEDVQQMAGWFYPGSRIIVTARDERLLLANGVKYAYEVKCLRFDEALQLFCHFALKQESPSDHIKQLSVRAIKLVGFRPLALKVTASMLFGRDMNFWETILKSL